ncbi:MAG: HDOD domain-containing protein [Bryobacteraceae bacterium]|jgi:EAL and modified HD-GYP domain-containing signal transduction protein
MDVWVARQPILDRKQQLYAYELLFRSHQTSDRFDGAEAASATTQVIADTILGIGLDNLLSGHKAFINFDRSLLLGGLCSILPRNDVVIEVLETVEPDAEVLAACRNLYEQGYVIALDDFVRSPETEPLTNFAHIVKVDIQATPLKEQERMLRAYQSRGICMLAEKVETREEFAWALAAGYDYFQGYFFARPVIVPGTRIPAVKAVGLRLLRETQQADLNFGRVEALIAGDVALSWQLLCYVNSALFYRHARINSIHQALAVLGENSVRQWAALATLSRLARDKPDELLVLSLVRAHFSEYLMNLANIPESHDAFLMGLFSLLDALLDLSLEEALRRADLIPGIGAALLETASDSAPLCTILRLVRAWESGDWAAVSCQAARAGIPVAAIGEAYKESTLWAEKALQGSAHRSYSRRRSRQAGTGVLKLKLTEGRGRERVLKATVIDISADGLRLQVAETIPLHGAVLCDAPELGICGRGSVRHCNSSSGGFLIGVECHDGDGWIRRVD